MHATRIITMEHAKPDLRSVYRPLIRNFHQQQFVGDRERSQVPAVLPNVHEVRRSPLQHAHGRLEVQRRACIEE